MLFWRSRQERRVAPPLLPPAQRRPALESRSPESEVLALFTPASPIVKEQLFAGRQEAIKHLVEATLERSRHAVLYGERGVGKTSLANMFWQRHASVRASTAARIQADPSDDFSSLWRKALRELGDRGGFTNQSATGSEPLTPDHVRRQLASYCRGSAIIIIDEFDRFNNPNDTVLMANLLKYLADYSVNCTVIIVGVAETASDLISDHASLRRCLSWVPLHRMTDGEVIELLETRLARLSINADRDAIDRIVSIARGLPFYVHSIAKGACLLALRQETKCIQLSHVEEAVEDLGRELRPSFHDDYLAAVSGTNENLYPQVLLACALAQGDDDGYFTAAAVVEPLSRVLRRPIQIASFQRHLAELASHDRGRMLVKRGQPRDYRFRFRDSLIHPYIIIAGLRAQLVEEAEAFTQLSRPHPRDCFQTPDLHDTSRLDAVLRDWGASKPIRTGTDTWRP